MSHNPSSTTSRPLKRPAHPSYTPGDPKAAPTRQNPGDSASEEELPPPPRPNNNINNNSENNSSRNANNNTHISKWNKNVTQPQQKIVTVQQPSAIVKTVAQHVPLAGCVSATGDIVQRSEYSYTTDLTRDGVQHVERWGYQVEGESGVSKAVQKWFQPNERVGTGLAQQRSQAQRQSEGAGRGRGQAQAQAQAQAQGQTQDQGRGQAQSQGQEEGQTKGHTQAQGQGQGRGRGQAPEPMQWKKT
ncbi:hypothetical protein LTR64_000111 [Lithohypha guttulata]|uniref:uncharacterized protein n=1 Tax=Lithohypha guttulata TaxID=1690604 RepID=UPI002DE0118A|nr:hypothetical protein LTR51_007473 [Lithohypha guttulata]